MAEITAVGFEPVDKAGDTMEGPLTLAGAPITNLEAATKKYVDDNASVTWGDINGTLSNQTDLQNALNSKADTSSLGNYATIQCNLNATTNPNNLNDSTEGYTVGSRWVNTVPQFGEKEFVCLKSDTGMANWQETTNYNNVFIPYNPPDEFNSGNFQFREATGEAGNNRIRLRTRNAVQSNINAYLLSNQSQNYTLVGYSDVEPPYSINPIDCVLSGPQAEGTGGTEQGFASNPAIGMPMGKIQMPFGKTANYFYGPIGSHGIDITLPGIELVNDTTYFMPVKVPFATTGLKVGINVGDATGKIRFRAFAPGGSNFGGNSRPIGHSISFWTTLLDNLTGQGAFNFSISSYDYSPVGYMYIAFRPEQITGTLTLADVVITDDNEALRYFGYSTLATPTPIFGYYIAGSQSLEDVDNYTNVQIPDVITQPFGINLMED